MNLKDAAPRDEPESSAPCDRNLVFDSKSESTSVASETQHQRAEFPPSIWGARKLELWMLICIVGFASLVSAFATPSFFPAIPVLAAFFDTSIENINLTATIYSVFQGVSPILWGSLSDCYGRRPVYMACVSVTIAANFALANINTFGALFGLRVLQAFGGAVTISLMSAVVGDITERKNRGGVQAVTTSIQMVGPTFGPLIGGALINRWSWRAIFWFLACQAVLALAVIVFLLPETNRHYCGDGSILPATPWHTSPYALYRRKRFGTPLLPHDEGFKDQWLPEPHKSHFLRWLHLLKQVDVILVLIPNALIYTTWYMILTSMSTNLTDNVHFSSLKVGLCYLPSGVGTLIAALSAGKTMNWNYRRHIHRVERKCQQDGVQFDSELVNIYQSRLEATVFVVVLMCAATLVYGWAFHYNVHYLVPVVMTFPVSLAATFFISTSTVILIDLFPDDSGASASCVNLSRCLICAAGLAALDAMQRGMTIGGTYTFMAGLCALSWVCIWAEIRFGAKFAQRRAQKE